VDNNSEEYDLERARKSAHDLVNAIFDMAGEHSINFSVSMDASILTIKCARPAFVYNLVNDSVE